ncbi:phosphatase [Agrobacterium albertimagni AOL15]|uniref:Phosphatase n=1 Tax=Agrobacterium albertimagni AOL15 TaxID=1156935 RepID=K2R0Y1_9HYPH|nr:dual specificity protein phosphatase family protein [Agrobacterium albertimagni]EKF61482.1 phosphatase [Agrobacterium albertimagni AOL15]
MTGFACEHEVRFREFSKRRYLWWSAMGYQSEPSIFGDPINPTRRHQMHRFPAPHLSRLDFPDAGGIAMMQCPGRAGNLVEEVAALKATGVDLVLSLIQDTEYPDLAAFAAAMDLHRLEWVRMPLVPGGVPGNVDEWPDIRARLIVRIAKGGVVAIHCWGGLGRTGVVAADLLMAFGFTADEAISHVREVRPGTIESQEQELWIKRGNSDGVR